MVCPLLFQFFRVINVLITNNNATLRSISVSVQTGKLPFITHLAHPVPPAHLSSLPSFSDPDEELEDGEKLDAACWKAYIEGNVVDIVVRHSITCTSRFAFVAESRKCSPTASSFRFTYRQNHTYYSLPPNYPSTVAKSQFAGLPFPMNQYIPQRIRSIVKSRLEFVGLWGLGGLNVGKYRVSC